MATVATVKTVTANPAGLGKTLTVAFSSACCCAHARVVSSPARRAVLPALFATLRGHFSSSTEFLRFLTEHSSEITSSTLPPAAPAGIAQRRQAKFLGAHRIHVFVAFWRSL